MKYIFLSVIIIAGFISCNKDSLTHGGSSFLVSSFKNELILNGIHDIIFDTLIYDQNQNLIKVTFISIDSQTNYYVDTDTYTFEYNNLNLPQSYIFTRSNNYANVYEIETHNLFFDRYNRILKDSLVTINTPNVDNVSSYYSYLNNNIVIQSYAFASLKFNYSGPANIYALNAIDSIYLTDGNTSRQAVYSSIAGVPYFIGSESFFMRDFSTHANPFYSQKLSSILGPFFTNTQANIDFLSKNASYGDDWITDSSGRVIKIVGPPGSPILTFTYSN